MSQYVAINPPLVNPFPGVGTPDPHRWSSAPPAVAWVPPIR